MVTPEATEAREAPLSLVGTRCPGAGPGGHRVQPAATPPEFWITFPLFSV